MFQNDLERPVRKKAVHSSLTKSELIEHNLREIRKGLRTRGINIRAKQGARVALNASKPAGVIE